VAAHWHQPRAGGRVGVAASKTGLCESADCAESVAAAAPVGRPTAAAQGVGYSTEVTICTASLTFSNYTFCPHSIFMCFVWISEQTAIISLHSIN